MNKKIAMLLCLLMASASIACVGDDADGLQACDEITNGRLYYVESDEQFDFWLQ